MDIKTIATNRKARHEYNIAETVEAGIVLTGSEIKSIRAGNVSMGDAYVRPDKGGMWLFNAHIARYDAASYQGHDPLRPRKLLLHKKQIRELMAQIKEKGFTLIPLRLYIKDSYAKLEIALGKGKKLYDKRESIAQRENKRRLERVIKTRHIKSK
ncbi:MAG: SsrA-binding protein SmpB [Dehalococcoidales bacterium]|nr:SsrA-binding protein SmpB [Dehalococcoidales bacterium]